MHYSHNLRCDTQWNTIAHPQVMAGTKSLPYLAQHEIHEIRILTSHFLKYGSLSIDISPFLTFDCMGDDMGRHCP